MLLFFLFFCRQTLGNFNDVRVCLINPDSFLLKYFNQIDWETSEIGAEQMSSKALRVAIQWDQSQLYQLAIDTIFKTTGSIYSITLFPHMIDRLGLNTGHLLTFTCLLWNDQRPNIIIQLVHASLRLCCKIRHVKRASGYYCPTTWFER